MDVRYAYDKALDDRLGSLQWNWIDSALEEGSRRKADLTMIGFGVQMLVDRIGLTESFRSKDRLRLLELLKKHRVSNVVLLSGDVHMA